jgi:hypothetical protein
MSHSILEQSSRRNFLKSGLLVLSACSLVVPSKNLLADDTTLPILDPADPTATALGYNHEASKVDTAKFPKKAAADGPEQKCNNCSLFQGGGVKVTGKEGDWGKCTIFQGKLVATEGWCNSWLKKQA